MKKRVLSLVLTLCLLLGLLPTAALAAPAETAPVVEVPAEVAEPEPVAEEPPAEPGEAAELSAGLDFKMSLESNKGPYYHKGGDLGAWEALPSASDTPGHPGRGNYDVYLGSNGHSIYANEKAQYRDAHYLMQPFQITVNVPAYTSRTVKFSVSYFARRNSQGSVWYWIEFLRDENPMHGWNYNAKNSDGGSIYSKGRTAFDSKEGGSGRRTISVTFENKTGQAKDVTEYMTYYVGASRSGSILRKYHHQLETHATFAYSSYNDIPYVAKVGSKFYTSLADAEKAYNNTSDATLTLLRNTSGNLELTKGGTVDLGDHTLTGKVIVNEASGAVTVKNGAVTTPNDTGVTHSGGGTLTLTDLTVTAQQPNSYYGVRNLMGSMTVDSNVTISPDLDANGTSVTLNGTGPTINGTGTQLYLHKPLTLTGTLSQTYRVKLSGTAATVDKPRTVVESGATEANADNFTDQAGKCGFFYDNGKIVARPYKVTFDPNGGTVSPTTTYVKSDGTAAAWPTPTKPGYTGTWNHENSGFTKDTTLTATWNAKAVAVTFDSQGGTNGGSYNLVYGKTYSLPNPTRDGYTFAGWFTAPSGGTQVKTTTKITNPNAHTLYAHWSRSNVTLHFNLNGGDTVNGATREVPYGGKLATLPTADRSGYTLAGWYTSATGGTKLTTSTVHTKTTTYYAHWTPKTITVTFKPNSSNDVGKTEKSVTYGGKYTLPAVPTKAGFTFGGWYLNANGTGDAVTANTQVTQTGNHTLYAKWTANTYTVTFDPNGGALGNDTKTATVTYNGKYTTLPAAEPTRTGYTFQGWYTAKEDGTKVEKGETQVTTAGNHTLYAQWKHNSVTVYYNFNGGKVSGNAQGSAGTFYDWPYSYHATPEREGYTFAGWYTAPTGGTEVAHDGSVKITNPDEHTLYAHWTPIEVTVNFDVNGGTAWAGSEGTKTVPYNQPYGELPTPTRDGQVFQGWYTALSGGDLVTSATTMNKLTEHTLHAHWVTAHTHTIGDGVKTFTELNAVPSGNTLTAGNYYLTQNIEMSNTITISGSGTTVNLCLNGHTITNTDTSVSAGAGVVFKVEGGATLNICDCKGGGEVTSASYPLWVANGAANLYGGTFQSTSGGCVQTGTSDTPGTSGTSGTLTVNGATINGGTSSNGIYVYKGSATLESGSVTGKYGVDVIGGATFEMKGGTVTGTENYGVNNRGTTIISGGTVTGKTHGISSGLVSNAAVTVRGDAVVKSTATSTTGSTTPAGINATAGTVTIEGDATVEGYTGVNATNGVTDLTISGGTVTGVAHGIASSGTAVTVSGDAVVKSTATNTSTAANTAGIYATAGTVTIGGNATVEGYRGVTANNSGTNLTISGGTITGTNNTGVASAAATTTISGTANITGNHGVYVDNNGTLNVQGGTITGTTAHGIYVSPTSKLTMTGGTVNADTASKYAVYLNGGDSPDANDKKSSIENATLTGNAGAYVGGNRVLTMKNTNVSTQYGSLHVAANGDLTAENCTVTSTNNFAILNYGTTTLNGGTLTSKSVSPNMAALYVDAGTATVNGATLICESTDNAALVSNGTATVKGNSVLTGYHGAIVKSGAILNVEGTPTITGTTASGISNSGTANIRGGVITGKSGYGVHTEKNSTTLVAAGTIISDTAAGLNALGTATVTAGTISGKTYGIGVGSTLNLLSTPTIHGDTADILVTEGKTLTVGGNLTGTFSVETSAAPTADTPVAITTANTNDEAEHFTSAQYGVRDRASDHAVELYVAHRHPICGAVCTHGGAHETVEWEPLPAFDDIQEGGHYYLTGNDNHNWPLNKSISLCLNGHSITRSDVPTIQVSYTLDLCDCSEDQTGAVTQTGDKVAVGVSGIFNQYGGRLSAKNQPLGLGANSTFNYYGGELDYTNDQQTSIHIETKGAVNLFGGLSTSRSNNFAIYPAGGEPIYVGEKPSKPYYVDPYPESFPHTLTTGWDATKNVADYFAISNARSNLLVLDPSSGEVVLRYRVVNVDGGGTLTAGREGKLTSTQLAKPWNKVGYTWDGYYTAENGGDLVTADTVFEDDATIYPKWTECTSHTAPTEGVTTIPATCTEAGSRTYVCTTCAAAVTETVPVVAHTYADGNPWTTNGDNHWHQCTVCGYHSDEAAHTWDAGSKVNHVITYTCTVCAQTKTETVPTYTVTFLPGEHTTGSATNLEAVEAGTKFAMPDTVTRTGYTLKGWVELTTGEATETTEDTPAAVAETIPTEKVYEPGAEYIMPDHDVTLAAQWTMQNPATLNAGDIMYLEDGTKIENTGNTTVTITQPDGVDDSGNPVTGGTTVITLPAGTTGGVTVTSGDGKDKVTVPSGSTVVTTPGSGDNGPTITIGSTGEGKVDGSGTVDAPVGSTVEFPDGNKVEIKDGTGVISGDGNISFPPEIDPATGEPKPNTGGGSVSVNGGESVTVGGQTEGMDAETAYVPEYIADPENTMIQFTQDGPIITLPVDPDGNVGEYTVNPVTGSVTLPAGSTVELKDGSVVTLDSGTGTVTPAGDVIVPQGGKATVTDERGNKTVEIVVAPGTNGNGTIKSDGNIELPTGGTVSVEDGAGGHTVITAPEGGGTIEKNPDTGALKPPVNSTITTNGGEPETVTNPDVQTVQPGSNHGITESLASGESKTIPHVGTIKNNGDGTVTLTDLHGVETTVTLPLGVTGVFVDTKTGEVTLPAGSTVTTGEGATITVPTGATGSVIPGGAVTGSPLKVGDATVTVTDPAEGGTVTVDKAGNVTVPGGMPTTIEKGDTTGTFVTPSGTGTVKTDGTIELPQGGTFTQGGTTITVPAGGTVTPKEDGTVDVTPGATVQTGETGEPITLPDGGTVDDSGNVTGDSVTVGDTTVTTTDPTKPITAAPSGNVTVPTVGGATVTDKDGNETTVTPGNKGDATVDPATGDITLPGGGSVTVPSGAGKEDTVITAGDQGGTVTPKADGTVSVPAGSTVQTGTGNPVEVGDQGGSVDPSTGEVTQGGDQPGPGPDQPDPNDNKLESGEEIAVGDATVERQGDTVTITTGTAPDETTTTVTVPADAEVTVDKTTGEVTVPEGSQVGTTPAMTLPQGGGVKPDGTVTVPEGGTVTVTDGTDTTTITPPTGGEVTPSGEGGVHVDKGTTVQTGTGPVITLPETGEGGTVQPGGTVSGSPVQVGDTVIDVTAADPTQGDITTDKDGNVTLPGGTTAKVDDGQGSETTVTVPDGQGGSTGDNATVKPGGDIDLPAGGSVTQGDTTVTTPDGGTVGKDDRGNLTVPDGSTVQTGTGTQITVGPGNGGTVDPTTGGVTPDNGGKVTIPDGNGGTTTVTPPDGGEVTPGTDGGVTAPGGSEVSNTDKDGHTTTDTVPEGGGTVKPDGTITEGGDTPTPDDGKLDSGETVTIMGGTVKREGDTVTITPSSGDPITVTVPAGGEVSVDADTGVVTVPGGSTVGTDPVITLPSGGSVTPYGAISGSPVKVGDTTVTAPNGSSVDANKDGAVNVPSGGTVQTGSNPTITMPEGGSMSPDGTVNGNPVKVNDTTVTLGGGTAINVPPSGIITLPKDSDATVEKDGVTATVTTPTGGTATVQPDGQIQLPEGGSVKTGDTTITAGAGGNTVTPGSGEVPAGATVQTGTSTPITVGSQGGTVDENGTVTVPEGGAVSITDGTNTTAITLPSGGEVEPREDSGVNVPGGSKVTKPDGSKETVPVGGAIVYPDGTIKTGDTPTPPKPKTFTVTFDAMGGSAVASQTVTENETATEPDAPTKTGYTFLGWFTDRTGATSYDFTAPVTNHITLYAQWEKDAPETVTVTFDAQGGDPVPEEQTVAAGKLVTKPAAPTREGYTFKGWFTEATDGAAWQFNTDAVTEDLTLYAQWEKDAPETVTVTFDAQGGEPVPEDQTVEAGKLVTKPTAPTQEGFTFKGWFTEATGGTPWQFNTDAVTEDLTLYAQWEETNPGTTVTPDAPVEIPGGGSVAKDPDTGDVTITTGGEGGSTTTVTPGEGDVTVDETTGEVTVPGGSQVTTPGGTTVELPGGGKVDGAGNITLPDSGDVVTVPGDSGTTTTITAPDGGGTLTTDPDTGAITVPGGSTVKPGENGPEITVPVGTTVDPATGGVSVPGNSDVTLDDGQGNQTTVTTPADGGDMKPTEDGKVEVPADSTVKPGNGTEITVPGGTTVDPATGDVNVPGNSDVTVKDQSGNQTTVTTPEGGGDVKPTDDGKVEVPNGTTVKPSNGTEITVPGGTTVDPATGGVNVPGNSTVTIPDGQGGKTEITIPADGGDVKPTQDGKVEVPDGTTVKPGNGTKITVPGGSTVDPATGGITVPGNSDVTLDDGQGNQTTVTTPANGGDVKPTQDGKVEVPDGTTVKPSNGTEITVPDGSTVDPATGGVNVPGSSDVTLDDGQGNQTTVTTPQGGGDMKPTEDGKVEVPTGTTVKPGNGAEITVPVGTTVDPATGDVTVPGGSTVTIPDGSNGKTEITLPSDGGSQTVTTTDDGKVEVPADTTVTTADGATLTVTQGAGTVAPDGTVTMPQGGTVTVTKDGETTTVTVTAGGSVSPDYTEPTPPTPSRPSSSSSRPSGYTPSIQQPEHGKVTVSPSRPTAGDKVTVTVAPEKGYEVGTVTVTDRNGKPVEVTRNADGTYTFTQPTGKVTVSATMKEACAHDETCPVHAFADADVNAWYHDGVHFCLEKGLMVGTSDTTFAPEMPTSRAMIATILWRLQGSKVVNYAMQYDDVPKGTWYTEAVRWATSEGIVNGYGDGTFGPDNPITREQLATMLYRYEQKFGGGGFTGMWMFLMDFADADQVSDWANEAMHWMTMNKVIEGKSGKALDPQGKASRAEAATMIQRFFTIHKSV